MDIKVGYTCNNRCLHCVIEPIRVELIDNKENIDLSTEELINKIDSAVYMDIKEIILTGGEVTLREDFQEIVTYAVKKGLSIIIQTNGRKFSDKEFCEFLKDIPTTFIIALHSSTEDIHDSITQSKGSFLETVEGIKNLRFLNKYVTSKIVISKKNADDLFNTVKLAKELGVNEFSVVFPHVPDYSKIFQITPKYFDIKEQIEKIAQFSEDESFRVSFETIPFCICPSTQPFWVRNCDLLAKATDYDFDSIRYKNYLNWEKVRPEMKVKSDRCNMCVLNLICEGPWREYIEGYGDFEFMPISKDSVRGLI